MGRHIRSHHLPATVLALEDIAAGGVVPQAGDWTDTLDLVADIDPLAGI